MSDAFHLLSDVASFIVALAAIYLAEKPPTKSMQMFHACTIRLLFFFFSFFPIEHTFGSIELK